MARFPGKLTLFSGKNNLFSTRNKIRRNFVRFNGIYEHFIDDDHIINELTQKIIKAKSLFHSIVGCESDDELVCSLIKSQF